MNDSISVGLFLWVKATSSWENFLAQSSPDTPLMLWVSRIGEMWDISILGSVPTTRLSKPMPSWICAIVYSNESPETSDDIVTEPRPFR